LPHDQDIPRLEDDEPLFLPPMVGDFVAKDRLRLDHGIRGADKSYQKSDREALPPQRWLRTSQRAGARVHLFRESEAEALRRIAVNIARLPELLGRVSAIERCAPTDVPDERLPPDVAYPRRGDGIE
jgi:hypothetical protein